MSSSSLLFHLCHCHLYDDHTRDSLKTVAASRDGQRRTALISLLIAFFFFQVKHKHTLKSDNHNKKGSLLSSYQDHHHHHYDQTANNGEQDVLFLFLKDVLGYPTAGSLFKTFYGFRFLISMLLLFILAMLMVVMMKMVKTSEKEILDICN